MLSNSTPFLSLCTPYTTSTAVAGRALAPRGGGLPQSVQGFDGVARGCGALADVPYKGPLICKDVYVSAEEECVQEFHVATKCIAKVLFERSVGLGLTCNFVIILFLNPSAPTPQVELTTKCASHTRQHACLSLACSDVNDI